MFILLCPEERRLNMKPMVSLCITSYNRLEKLRSCIDSFFMTNMYDTDSLELVIVDNGSDSDVVEYIRGLQPPCAEFKFVLNEINKYPYCLRAAKNQAREVATGEYFIDCPDDHLFVFKSDWISETIGYLGDETEKISCVCHYAYPLYRFDKPNNKMHTSDVSPEYFVSELKGYADYHIMSRSAYDDIGKYREDLGFTPNAESEYMDRSLSLGYRRAMIRLPVSIVNDDGYRLLKSVPIDWLNNSFSFDRPIDNESVVSFALKEKIIS
jgi:glycosyltransferase involved in cell wall biosynthesis